MNMNTTTTTTSKSGKRAANWSGEELEALIEQVQLNKIQILGSFSQFVTAETRKDTWEKILTNVNAVNPNNAERTLQQLNNKWWDVKSKAKQRISQYRRELKKTGGGIVKVKEPTEMDYKIISIIGEEAVDGIPGTESYDTGFVPPTIPTTPTATLPSIDSFESSSVAATITIESDNDNSIQATPMSKKRKRNTEESLLEVQSKILNRMDDLLAEHQNISHSLKSIAESLALKSNEPLYILQ